MINYSDWWTNGKAGMPPQLVLQSYHCNSPTNTHPATSLANTPARIDMDSRS